MSLCPVTSSSSSCVSASSISSYSIYRGLFNLWFGFLTLSSYLDEITTETPIWFDVSVLSVSLSNIALFALLEVKFVRDFIVFVFQNFQNFSKYWTTGNRKQAETILKYCRSCDMIRDHCAWIFAKHHYVNKRSFVLCTLFLTYVLYVVI